MDNRFLKYISKVDKGEVFHSSAYARAQNAGAIGAASTESFGRRMEINENRKKIKGYSDSKVVSGALASAPKPKKYAPSEDKSGVSGSGATDVSGSSQQGSGAQGGSAGRNGAVVGRRDGPVERRGDSISGKNEVVGRRDGPVERRGGLVVGNTKNMRGANNPVPTKPSIAPQVKPDFGR